MTKKTIEEEKKAHEEKIENEINDFNANIVPFSIYDVESAIEYLNSYNILSSGYKLAGLVEEWIDQTNVKLNDIDVCCIAYEHIFQSVRNDINNYLKIDIANDLGYYVYGSYVCTLIDYSDNDKNQLQKAIKKADKKTLNELLTCDFVEKWLNEIDIEI